VKKNGATASYSVYNKSGQLLLTDGPQGVTRYIYLGSQLIARIGNTAAAEDKPGYTGHLEDDDLSLTYMQQRYYDPLIGRFYSNDPVGFTPQNPVMSFNRYMYVNNNPYKYTDPNGEYLESLWDAASLSVGLVNLGSNISNGNWEAAALDALGVVADGVALALPIVPGGASMVISGSRAGANALSDSALVARGGANITPQSIENATSTHPSGVTGFSAQCNGGTCLNELGSNIPNGQMGVTTVGDIRAAGGDVVVTSGRGNHVTVTGLDSNTASQLLSPSVPNPVSKQDRNL
jgi:RHS repeat-associated protein